MPYLGGTLAISVGSNCLYSPTAPRRARVSCGWRCVGLIGNASETDSSSARIDVATLMKALARFGVEVARKASTKTRIKISSADGAGISSGATAPSGSITTLTSDAQNPRGQADTPKCVKDSGFPSGLDNARYAYRAGNRSPANSHRRLGLG